LILENRIVIPHNSHHDFVLQFKEYDPLAIRVSKIGEEHR